MRAVTTAKGDAIAGLVEASTTGYESVDDVDGTMHVQQ